MKTNNLLDCMIKDEVKRNVLGSRSDDVTATIKDQWLYFESCGREILFNTNTL